MSITGKEQNVAEVSRIAETTGRFAETKNKITEPMIRNIKTVRKITVMKRSAVMKSEKPSYGILNGRAGYKKRSGESNIRSTICDPL